MVSIGLPLVRKLRIIASDDPSKKQNDRKGVARWLWPIGVVGTGVAAAAVVLMRGCWHRKMSWPIRVEGYSYQVCLGCGIKRLFDEATFHGFGPYDYDLRQLIARDRVTRIKSLRDAEEKISSAS